MARRRANSPGSDFEPSAAKRNISKPAAESTCNPLRSQRRTRQSPRKQDVQTVGGKGDSEDESETQSAKLRLKSTPRAEQKSKQIRLAPLGSMNGLGSIPHLTLRLQAEHVPRPTESRGFKLQPRRVQRMKSTQKAETLPALDGAETDIATEDVEESIWCGSDAGSDSSDGELPSPRKLIKMPKQLERQSRPQGRSKTPEESHGLDGLLKGFKSLQLDQGPALKRPKSPAKPAFSYEVALSRPGSSSDKENDDRAILRFTPPRLYSPPKSSVLDRPATPPPVSPSKSRLVSPSKTKPKIPMQPLRQSLDAFWHADAVNDWNDQYSPEKPLRSPKKNLFKQRDSSNSPTSSPRKLQSPSKRTKAELEAKRSFESRKRQIAADFLDDLDQTITKGEIKKLAASTGGVQLIWSKSLNSTAGRANWRRETTKTRELDGSVSTTHRHHASIELAEKVIDDEHRLVNVIAHEFCHLANFMVSGIKDQPHGKQFKAWGARCTAAFGDSKGVEVTTKHSYQIDYKYIWQCRNEECLADFKRHSKSIDPKRHRCGTCRGELAQVKPVPRKEGAKGSAGGGGYAAFVKKHFAAVRKELPPGASQKEVMEAVGRKYRADKEAAAKDESKCEDAATGADEMDNVVRKLEFVILDDT